MIEIIYKDEKKETENGENVFTLPRNIRQVGLTTGNIRIYIEDYVYTFLIRLTQSEISLKKEQGCAAVFTGETKWNDGITYLFIRGALQVEDMEAAPDHIDFSEKVWMKIQENQAKYFPGQEITGWFFSRPQMYMEMDELLSKIHLRYFGGEKVLMLMEPAEKEEAFFFYENGLMIRQRGYYIYYEKNPLMQEYMIEKNKEFAPELTEKVTDEAVVSFRKIIKNKKTKKPEKTEEKPQEEMEHTSVFSYAATASLVLAVLAVGAGFYRNYKDTGGIPEQDYAVTVMSEKNISVTPEIMQEEAEGTKKNEIADNNKNASLQLDNSGSDENAGVTEMTDSENDNMGNGGQEESGSLENDSLESASSENGSLESANAEGANSKNTDSENTALESVNSENTNAENTNWGNDNSDSSQENNNSNDSALQNETAENFPQEADERKIRKQDTTQASSDSVHETYVIKPGDTLYQISLSHYGNMDAIEEICRLNNLTENQVIYPGQMIVLP